MLYVLPYMVTIYYLKKSREEKMANILYTINDIKEEVDKSSGGRVYIMSMYKTIRNLNIKPIKKGGWRNRVGYYSEIQKRAIVEYYVFYFERRQVEERARILSKEIHRHINWCKDRFGK